MPLGVSITAHRALAIALTGSLDERLRRKAITTLTTRRMTSSDDQQERHSARPIASGA
jgi:hypothetical protein